MLCGVGVVDVCSMICNWIDAIETGNYTHCVHITSVSLVVKFCLTFRPSVPQHRLLLTVAMEVRKARDKASLA